MKSLYLLKLNRDTSEENPIEPEPSKLTAVFPEESIYSQGEILKFFTINKSPYVIAHIQLGDRSKYLWLDVRHKQAHIEDLSDLLPEEPMKLWWEANDDRNLYAFYNDHTNRMDIKTKAIFPNISPKDIPINRSKLNGPSQGSIPDEDNATWLEFNEHKIGLWDKNTKNTQWIYDKGRHISQVFWANKNNTIIFKDDSKIFLLDKNTFGQTRLQKILNIRSDTTIHYSERTGKLYYIDPKKQQFSSMTILRHKPILPKSIADTLRLKEYEP